MRYLVSAVLASLAWLSASGAAQSDHVDAQRANGDGFTDIVAASSVGDTLSVLLDDGRGGFAPSREVRAGFCPIAVAAGDFDADGKTDLAVANYSDYRVTILEGNGQGGFSRGAITFGCQLTEVAPPGSSGLLLGKGAGGSLTAQWPASSDPCLDGYRIIGSQTFQTDAGYSTEIESGLETSTTFTPNGNYFLILGTSGGNSGPWGSYGH